LPDRRAARCARSINEGLRPGWIAWLIVPAYAAGMAAVFAATWVWLGRDFTARTFTATLYIAVAAAIASATAALAARLLRRSPWSARIAAVLILLISGTAALASLFLAVETAWATHPMSELPMGIALLILAIIGAGALYGFLAIAGPLILPLGLPLVAVSAWLIARRPR
jgi:hypothetical protein